PVRTTVPQGYLNAAANSAGAALVGLFERNESGRGQLIDVSAQASLLQSTMSMVLADPFRAPQASRMAGGYTVPPLDIKMVWTCQDGMVTVTFMFGLSVGFFTKRLMEWVHEEGFCSDEMLATDWVRFSAQVQSGEETIEKYEQIKETLQTFLLTKTKAELLEASLERGLLIAPITTIADVADSPQLADRDFWEDVERADGTTERHCGPIAKFGATPLAPLSPAPLPGADTIAIRREPRRHLSLRTPDVAPEAPLAGMKVLDFTWAMAGPAATRVLADYGATVIRVETAVKIEAARQLQPFLNAKIDNEGSGVFLNLNVNKLGVAINLADEASRDVVHDLIRWADVVAESFTPGVMADWGYGYDAIRAVNPGVVMFQSALMGQTGPLRDFAGYGNLSAAICGFYNVTGWPDRWPTGPYVAYTDYVSPWFTLPVLLAAFDHKRRTGEGQLIDFSQMEASLYMLGSAFTEYFETGAIVERQGNRDPQMAPHGVFPTSGDDEWIAIAIDSDEAWASLCTIAGFDPALAELSVAQRLARAEEVEELLA
ncbi:MAG TPA: CoA transferase, partial [Ilumatobacteraceae bacterium]|nr:CoA transferase [Ilumatobacteraceae bacterium]